MKEKAAKYLPHSSGRYQIKRFRKATCPIAERLASSLMAHGRNNGKKLMTVRIVKHAFEIIHLLTGEVSYFLLFLMFRWPDLPVKKVIFLKRREISEQIFFLITDNIQILLFVRFFTLFDLFIALKWSCSTAFNLKFFQNPVQILVNAVINSGPREDSTRIGRAGTVRRQAVDVAPLRRVNQVSLNLFCFVFRMKMLFSMAKCWYYSRSKLTLCPMNTIPSHFFIFRLSGWSALVPANLPSETSRPLLSAWLMSSSTPPRDPATRTPSRRRTSLNV